MQTNAGSSGVKLRRTADPVMTGASSGAIFSPAGNVEQPARTTAAPATENRLQASKLAWTTAGLFSHAALVLHPMTSRDELKVFVRVMVFSVCWMQLP
jgi:hypothetical protein